jgi:thioredoxin
MELDILTFADAIDSDTPVLVKFEASWCKPCKTYAPTFEQFAAENPDIKCYSVDCEKLTNVAAEFGIMSIPCTIVFKDGKDLARKQGKLTLQEIKDLHECKL